MKPVIYIAHPLGHGEDREANRDNAAKWVAWAALYQDVAPVADWIILSGQFDESHRDLGLACDVALVKRCDALWLVGGRISPGMHIEATVAFEADIPVYDLTHFGFQVPGEEKILWSSMVWRPQ